MVYYALLNIFVIIILKKDTQGSNKLNYKNNNNENKKMIFDNDYNIYLYY